MLLMVCDCLLAAPFGERQVVQRQSLEVPSRQM
jgi:hypothetical protein